MNGFETFSSIAIIVCSTFGIICALIFIIIVAIHRQCHTLTILLVLNSTIAGLMASITCFSQSIYQLLDLHNDNLCSIRGLILHTTSGILYHTLCVQALHRLFVTVFSTRRYLQTVSYTISMVGIQWIFSTTFALPMYFTDRIKYQPKIGICQVSMEDQICFLYMALIIFFIPLILIVCIYVRIVQYMKNSPFSTIQQQPRMVEHRRRQCELRLIHRILQLIVILFILGFPYFLFYLLIQCRVISLQPVLLQISYLFIAFGQSISMFIHLITTDDVRKYLSQFIQLQH